MLFHEYIVANRGKQVVKHELTRPLEHKKVLDVAYHEICELVDVSSTTKIKVE